MNSTFSDELETLEDFIEFQAWRQKHKPLTKSRVPMVFEGKPKESEADTIRRVLNLLEQSLRDGKLDLATFEKYREMGEGALQRLEGNTAGSDDFAKSIVNGVRLGTTSFVETNRKAMALQNLSGRVGADYFSSWENIGR